MKVKYGFIIGILCIAFLTLVPLAKSYTSTEYLPEYGGSGIYLPQLVEGDVLRWSFQTHDGQFYVRVWLEDEVTHETDLLSENQIQDEGDWIVPSNLAGDNCILWFYNLGWQDGYIDIFYELNPEPPLIPGFNPFLLIAIFSVGMILITKKVSKSKI